ncbi:sugar transferase, PEP-CTERM system associated protein [Desulfovibrio sp. X2]|uniref:TIGR03013 family XrtA/PEP-CTERM system glycosyltransferase n=1 Tax=Desulfovibrio sp. X2 TaxID=941449 RepID=UPI000358EC31|nr:TIGR03013 family XrtA/PEP-CTERM system glycosyltransferase [Desulfovibrio sp. X2]EPR37249.1 sugar transferase, PEP-CTERM system associated protein [Desulfovibrio sp. X2]
MRGMILKTLANDILWALLALAAAVAALTPTINDVLGREVFYGKTGGFLLIAVLPSVLVGGILSTGRMEKFLHALLGVLVAGGLSLLTMYAMDSAQNLTRDDHRMILLGLGFFALLKIGEFLFRRFRHAIPGMVDRVLVVGNGPLAEQMGSLIAASGGRYVFLGRVDCPGKPDEAAAEGCENRAGRFLRVAQNFMADKLVVSLAERRGVFPVQEMLSCKLSGIEVMDAPSFYEQVTEKLLIENITPSWFIFSHGFKVTSVLRGLKRLSDIVLSLVGCVIALPIVPFVILAIKLDSPGPILFRQVRVGQSDRPFTLNKFRTMRQDAEAKTGAVWSQVDDPRITKVGRFLRKSRLDEIPQLYNILVGDMSLVGPRPERPEFVAKLKERIPYYSERHYVKPGLTGWAQVCYPYGSSVEDAIEKLRYDLYYIKNISFTLDIRIILRTVGVVLFGKGR